MKFYQKSNLCQKTEKLQSMLHKRNKHHDLARGYKNVKNRHKRKQKNLRQQKEKKQAGST